MLGNNEPEAAELVVVREEEEKDNYQLLLCRERRANKVALYGSGKGKQGPGNLGAGEAGRQAGCQLTPE